jgi:hypothetical protein
MSIAALLMPGSVTPWNSKEWEKHIQLLLKRRYAHPPGSYQHVPDTVRGDGGIEGFALQGLDSNSQHVGNFLVEVRKLITAVARFAIFVRAFSEQHLSGEAADKILRVEVLLAFLNPIAQLSAIPVTRPNKRATT